MAIKVMADNNEVINVAQDAALYNVFAGNSDFIIDGIGNEMIFNHNAASLNATLGSGECVICGRHVTITGTESITLSASSSGYIVLRYDTTQSGSNIVRLRAVSSVRSDNKNNTGTIHDLVIGQYATNASGVSSYTDMRVVLDSVSGTAQKLATARTISLTGAVTGSVSFDGSANVSMTTSVGTAPTILSGTTAPTSGQGKDGDIYIQYTR